MPTKKKLKSSTQLPDGIHRLYIKGVKAPLLVQLQAVPVGYTVSETSFFGKALKAKETIPEDGHQKYYVDCTRLDIYTAIGADNQHHASNKATKLFGPHWTCVSQRIALAHTQFRTPKEFKELLATLPN